MICTIEFNGFEASIAIPEVCGVDGYLRALD
jgi:hypothetical protein